MVSGDASDHLGEWAELQRKAIDFAAQLDIAGFPSRDREGTFDRDGWRKCARFGVLGMPVPGEYGGADLPLVALVGVMEGLGYACRDQGLLFSLNAHLWTLTMPIVLHGTTAQKEKYLPLLTSGEWVGANAASEPGAGSDVYGMTTRAVRTGDEYVLAGTKTFVTNGPVADVFVAYATVNREYGAAGITAFIVERNAPGLTVGPAIEKMGIRTSPFSEVFFDECRVPVENRLGREGRGAAVFEASMEWERGCILSSCVGAMRWLLERCIDYASSRQQYGMKIGAFQSVANMVVDMKVRLEACRRLLYDFARKRETRRSVVDAAIVKLFVSEAYVQTCLDAIQIHGGYGYTTDLGIERELRNAVGSRLYSGTSEIQRNIIARGIGLPA